ncbi:MAG: hypothetical protein ACTSWY_04495 [Promethearchaeota archaeon]
MDRSDLESCLKWTLKQFREKDWILLKNNVSERCIAHKIAEYLNIYLKEKHDNTIKSQDLSVDCEYNRFYTDSKRIDNKDNQIYDIFREKLKNRKLEKVIDIKELMFELVTPDIIIHKRDYCKNNLCVIEIKKDTDSRSIKGIIKDEARIHAFMNDPDFSYDFGVFIKFYTEKNYKKYPDIKLFFKIDDEITEIDLNL